MSRLQDKVAIISGAARGMGASHARRFAQEGASVVLGDVLDEQGAALAEQLRADGFNASYLNLDVTQESDWAAAAEFAEKTYGGIDILVNNAGIAGSMLGVADETLDDWNRTIGVNQTGVFLGMRAAVPAMRRRGKGAIVNICSIWGMVGAEDFHAYQASKGAVQLMTKNAALTLVDDHIRVNSICPGLVDTPMAEEEGPDSNAAVIRLTPMKRMARPEELSNCVLFLASDEASYVTGTELVVDGGYLAQ